MVGKCGELLDVRDNLALDVVDGDRVKLDEWDNVEWVCKCCVREHNFEYWMWKLILYVMLLEGSQSGGGTYMYINVCV